MLTLDLGVAAWVLLCGAASTALVRLILVLLAAHAARMALKSSPAEEAHRRAVLHALLDRLRPPRR